MKKRDGNQPQGLYNGKEIIKKSEKEEEGAMGKRGAVKNYENSPEIVIGLYMVYYIFWHTKKLNSAFIERGKMDSLYTDILGIERGRFGRIKSCGNFRMSQLERKAIEERIGLRFDQFGFYSAPKIFRSSREDWSAYLETKKKEENEGSSSKEADKIKKELQKSCQKVKDELEGKMRELEEGTCQPPHPLYNIYYYMVNGTKYVSKKNTELAIEALDKVKVKEWAEERDKETLKAYRDILGKHYQFVESLYCIHEKWNG